jgi:DNA modification methylase
MRRPYACVMRDPNHLVSSPWNPRRHPRKQIRQLTQSIQAFGFVGVVVIDENGQILAGHGRVEAAIAAGLHSIPCMVVTGLTEAAKRLFVLADNKIALNARWDEASIVKLLDEIVLLDPDCDIQLTGFDTVEIDQLYEIDAPLDSGDPADEALPEDAGTIVTRPGELWHCGPHRILCGNALEAGSYEQLMGGEVAELGLHDPPYNVPMKGHISGLGRVRHRDFAMAHGELDVEQFTSFLQRFLEQLAAHSRDGSIQFVFMDWRHMGEISRAGERASLELKNVIVWVKDNGGMGTFYRSRHELVFVFKCGTAAHINNFELGQRGRYRTNVWEYAGLNSGGASRREELAMHPTAKPVALLADAMLDCSRRNGIVLDAFGGSGSTMIAAERTGRRARLIELDPLYVDRAVRRWQTFAGETAVHAATGRSFDDHLRQASATASVCTRLVGRPHVRRVDFGRAVR